MPGILTFDDVRNMLLIHEQRVHFLWRRTNGSLTHPAFVSNVTQGEVATHSQTGASNQGHRKNNRNKHSKNNRNNNKGKNNSNKQTSRMNSSTRGVPTVFVLCNSDLSLLNIQCTSASATNSLSAGNETFERVLGSGPNVVCQICHSPGHTAAVCSIRCQPHSTRTFPAMASFMHAEPSETLWYPNSAAASHMTPDEANF